MLYDAGVGSAARDEIVGLLAAAGAGSFVSRRTAPAEGLVIEVKGVGPLRLPLAREQIRLLLAKTRPARYGRREATLLDRRVRDAGEIPASEVKRQCHHCRRLGAFLSSPEQQKIEWPLAKEGRQHVHGRIDRHELPVRHQTRRSGSPYTLVLEKAPDLISREAVVRRAWQADFDWLSAASRAIRAKGRSGDASA